MTEYTVWLVTPDSPISVVSYTIPAPSESKAVAAAKQKAGREGMDVRGVDNVCEV